MRGDCKLKEYFKRYNMLLLFICKYRLIEIYGKMYYNIVFIYKNDREGYSM